MVQGAEGRTVNVVFWEIVSLRSHQLHLHVLTEHRRLTEVDCG